MLVIFFCSVVVVFFLSYIKSLSGLANSLSFIKDMPDKKGSNTEQPLNLQKHRQNMYV